MAELVIETATPLSVELGIFGGRGCIAMGLAHQQMKTGYCFGVDPWCASASKEGANTPENDKWWSEVDYKGVHKRFVSSVLGLDLWEYVRWFHGTSGMASWILDASKGCEMFGVMHQDSNHSEEISCKEVMKWLPYLSVGGYWILDDADWNSTQKALGILDKNLTMVEDHVSWVVFRKDKTINHQVLQ